MFTTQFDSDSARSRLSTALFTLCLIATSVLPLAALVQPLTQAQAATVACTDGSAHVVATARGATAEANS